MVTRKPLTTPLQTSTPSTAASSSQPNAPPYPITPHPESAKTTATGSSVYSPDLHNSPAFDLIDMREAQQRTRRDSDVSSHGTWDSEDTEPEGNEADDFIEVPKPLNIRSSQQNLVNEEQRQWQQQEEQKREAEKTAQEQHKQAASPISPIPDILKPGRGQPTVKSSTIESSGQSYAEEAQANPWRLDSNNPYLKQKTHFSDNAQAAWSQPLTPTIAIPAAPAIPATPAAPPPPPPVQAPPQPPAIPSIPNMSRLETQPAAEVPASQPLVDNMSDLSLYAVSPHIAQRTFDFPKAPSVTLPSQDLLATANEDQNTSAQAFPPSNPWRSSPGPDSRSEAGSAFSPPPAPQLAVQAPTPHQEPHYPPPPGPPPGYVDRLIDHEEPTPRIRQENGTQPPNTTDTNQHSASAAQVAAAQRNTIYQIKHITWTDASYAQDPRMRSETRTSPILIQNANGPCPLLALVNALVLTTPSNEDTPLVHTLRSREDISLELLLSAVFDELTSGRRGSAAEKLPDISELYSFLLTLHTGMNVNPQFVTPAITPRGSLDGYPSGLNGMHPVHRAQRKAGSFQETKEMRLYSTFNIPLIHGWVPPNDTAAYQAFARSAHTFEDAQNIQFAEMELVDKSNTSTLSDSENQLLQDIRTIKHFLNTWPTHLTEFGLESISRTLASGDIAILFRNDHFSLLYKEPRHGALMTLVTDAGYRSHEEIVWESLVDVNGAASELFSGDFRSVSHAADVTLNQSSSGGGTEGWQQVQSRNHGNRNAQAPLHVTNSSSRNDATPPPLPGPRPHERPGQGSSPNLAEPSSHQRTASEQEDHDMALALQLQMEEEEQERSADERRRREHDLTEQFLSNEERPPVPPRRSTNRVPTSPRTNARFNATSNRQGVSRPAEEADSDAPPTYEQAASDRPYRPAGSTAPPTQGNPLGTYDALRSGHRSSTSVNTIDMNGRRRSDINRIRRRSSQMGTIAPRAGYTGENSPTGGPGQAPAYYPGRTGQAANVNNIADERCVMM